MTIFSCRLCEEETVITVHLCEKCRKIKHLMNIYTRDTVYDVLDKVLIRNTEQRDYKIKNYKAPEKKEIDNTDESYIKQQHKEINTAILDKFK